MIRLAAGKLKPEHPQLSKKFHGTRKRALNTGLTHEKLDKRTAIMYILHTGDTNDKAIF